jgi:hypothetical protein
MEELQPQELEELVQGLEWESGEEEEMLSSDVEELLRSLQAGSAGTRLEAAHQLGDLSSSNPRIVQALIAAQESDSNSTVRWYAADAVRAPVHQRILEQHPDLVQRAQVLVTEAAAVKRVRQQTERRAEQRASQAAREASTNSFWLAFSPRSTVGLLCSILAATLVATWQQASQGQRLGVAYGGLGFLVGSYAALATWKSILLDVTCFVVPAAVALAIGPLVGLLAGWGIGTLVRRKKPEHEPLARALGALLSAFIAGFVVWGVIASLASVPPS